MENDAQFAGDSHAFAEDSPNAIGADVRSVQTRHARRHHRFLKIYKFRRGEMDAVRAVPDSRATFARRSHDQNGNAISDRLAPDEL